MLLALALVGLGFLAVGTFWLLEQSMPPYYAAMLMGNRYPAPGGRGRGGDT